MPLLFPWQPGGQAEPFDNARAERVLDDLWQADPQKVFSRGVGHVIAPYQPDCTQVPVDTTSKRFDGDDADPPEAGVAQIASGHSKDLRPDLKQLLLGVGMSKDGLLLLGEVSSGNQSGMTFNGHWRKRVREPLSLGTDECLRYVADSAVVTTNNLLLLRENKLDILSRLPERWSLGEELMDKAEADNSPRRGRNMSYISNSMCCQS